MKYFWIVLLAIASTLHGGSIDTPTPNLLFLPNLQQVPTIADSATLTNPTVATVFNQKATWQIGQLYASKSYLVWASGKVSFGIIGNLQLGLNVGGAEIVNSTPMLGAVVSNVAWHMISVVTVRTAGAGGTQVATTNCIVADGTTKASGGVGRSAGAVALNTTVARDVEVTALFGTTNAGNNITMEQFLLLPLN